MHSFSFLSEHSELEPLASLLAPEVLERLAHHPVVRDIFLYFVMEEVGSQNFLQRLVAIRAFVYESDWLRGPARELFFAVVEDLWSFLVGAGVYVGSLPPLPMGDRKQERKLELDRCLRAQLGEVKARHAAQELAGLIRDGLVLDAREARGRVGEAYPEFAAYTLWLSEKYPGLFHDAHLLACFFHQKSVDIVS